MIGVPHRYDLNVKSCVNEEVKVYNRKLKKCLKTCENTEILEIDSNRDLFTKHGLHLNSKGKDQIAEKIAQTIKIRLNRKMKEPITLKDRDILRAPNKDTERMVETIQTGGKEVQLTQEVQLGSIPDQEGDKLPPKRIRKPPNTRHNDFLWLDRKINQM